MKKISQILILLFLVNIAFAKKFKFQSITKEDWEIPADSLLIRKDAFIVSKKVTFDEAKSEKKNYHTEYRKIRILNSDGRDFADITVPYNDEIKIKKIVGRTILPSGKVIRLDKSKIFDHEVLKTKGVKIKSKTFSLPSVTSNCIIEYQVEIEVNTKDLGKTELIQKGIFTKNWELKWKFYKSGGLPNYAIFNTVDKVEIEKLPNLKRHNAFLFKAKNIKPFESEPYTMPDSELKMQVKMYYSTSFNSGGFWSDMNGNLTRYYNNFTTRNKKIRKAVKKFGDLKTPEAKIKAAYKWSKESIINLNYEKSKKEPKEHTFMSELLGYGYGTASDVNVIFWDMLREMNLRAYLVYTYDRTEKRLAKSFMKFQFNKVIVYVSNENKIGHFFSPGEEIIPIGEIAWGNEGTHSLILEHPSLAGSPNIGNFIDIPISEPSSNSQVTSLDLKLNENLEFVGKLNRQETGAFALRTRSWLFDEKSVVKKEYLQKVLEGNLESVEVDSIEIKNENKLRKPLEVNCKLDRKIKFQRMGKRLLLNPSVIFKKFENSFTEEDRKFSIHCNFTQEKIEKINLDLPTYWEIEALPEDSFFTNEIGSCQVSFKSLNEGKTLLVQKSYVLKGVGWVTKKYPKIKKLNETRELFDDLIISLKEVR